MTLSLNDTHHSKALPFCWVSLCWVLRFIYHYAECNYAECRYTECRYAECRYAECRYAECRYAECNYAECRYAECCYAEYRSARFSIASLRDRRLQRKMFYNIDVSLVLPFPSSTSFPSPGGWPPGAWTIKLFRPLGLLVVNHLADRLRGPML